MDSDLYKSDCFGDPKCFSKPIKEIEVNKYFSFFSIYKKYITGEMETCTSFSQS